MNRYDHVNLEDAERETEPPQPAAQANGHADEPPKVVTPRLVLTLAEFLSDFQPPEYLVDGLVQRHFCYSFTGATGAGKTAVATLLSVLVGHPVPGQKFGPHAVEPGRVVYIAAENKTDVQMRFIALCAKLKVDRSSLNLLVTSETKDLVKQFERVASEIRAFGDVDLVIVDTAPALFPGDDENSNTQAGRYARDIRRLTSLPGHPCVLALYHPIKRPSSADDLLPRGGGAAIAEFDGNLTLWAMDDKLSELHWRGKFRGPDFAPISFHMEKPFYTMDLVDRKGRPMPTVVASYLTDADAAENEQKAVFQENQLLAALMKRPQASLTELAEDCQWFLPAKAGAPPRPYKSLVVRVMKRLESGKLVSKAGRTYAVTKAGKQAAPPTASVQ